MAERRDLIDPRPEPASAQPGPGSESSPRRHSFASDAVGTGLLTLVLGLWLIVSPLVFDYRDDDSVWLPLAAGAAIALAALLRMTGVRMIFPTVLIVLAAVGLFAGAFLLAESDLARWNALGCAAIAVWLLSAGAGAVSMHRATGGRGYGA
jgi:hypothetical protein